MSWCAEAPSQWDFWKRGRTTPFVVTEWNPHLLEEHLRSFPEADILFTSHFHDLLPKVLARFPALESRIFVPDKGTREFSDHIIGRPTKIQVIPMDEIFPRKVSEKPIQSFLILNELHPYGGLVPALTLIEELRKSTGNLPVFEHQIPVREMFVPNRDWSIHSFPPSAADITFSWRRVSGTEVPPADLDPGTCLVLYLPLHLGPPVSLSLWKSFGRGARIVAPNTPFTRDLAGPGVYLFSPAHFDDFDPFQSPPGSPVNRALAGSVADRLKEWFP